MSNAPSMEVMMIQLNKVGGLGGVVEIRVFDNEGQEVLVSWPAVSLMVQPS